MIVLFDFFFLSFFCGYQLNIYLFVF